jgi:hypothetical protein
VGDIFQGVSATYRRGAALEHHAEVLRGGIWRPRAPGWPDAAALVLVLSIFVLVGVGAHLASAPFAIQHQPAIRTRAHLDAMKGRGLRSS